VPINLSGPDVMMGSAARGARSVAISPGTAPADRLYTIKIPFERAKSRSFFIFGIDVKQRGRRSELQVCLLKSSNKKAVVLGSTVTSFSSGGGGVLMEFHSAITS